MRPQRDAFFDGLKGIAIISVIAIHAANSGIHFYSLSPWSPNFTFTLVWTQALQWAVPVFFFVSGYWAGRKPLPAEQYFAKRASRLLIPYVIWSVIIVLYFQRSIDLLIAKKLVFGTAVGPFYFVVALIVLVLSTPILVRLTHQSGIFLCLISVITTAHLAISYAVHAAYPDANWWYFMYPPSAWLCFYAYGLLRGREEPVLQGQNYRTAIILCVALLIASIVEAFFLTKWIGVNGGGLQPIKITSIAFAFAVIHLALSTRSAAFWRFFAPVGSLSFGIYLIHEPIRAKISTLLAARMPVLDAVQPVFQFVVIITTLTVSAALVATVRRFLPRVSIWIGFSQ